MTKQVKRSVNSKRFIFFQVFHNETKCTDVKVNWSLGANSCQHVNGEDKISKSFEHVVSKQLAVIFRAKYHPLSHQSRFPLLVTQLPLELLEQAVYGIDRLSCSRYEYLTPF